jgi:hypothetical protein
MPAPCLLEAVEHGLGREKDLNPIKEGWDEPNEGCVLQSWRLGTALIVGGVCSMAAVDWALFALSPEDQFTVLGPTESTVVLIALTLQIMSMLQQATLTFGTTVWTSRIVFTVKAMAAVTNYLLLTRPSPFVVDSLTGRSSCMLRFSEWTVMSFLVVFVVDQSDANELRGPLMMALGQAASTGISACLGYVSARWLWVTLLTVSCSLFFTLVGRLYARRQRLHQLESVLPSDSYRVLRAKLAMRLNWQCAFFWSLLVGSWFADVFGRAYLGYGSSLDAGTSVDLYFIADCVIDVAKLFYADIVQSDTQAFPVIFRAMRGREVRRVPRAVSFLLRSASASALCVVC